jgi:hypothetical protein
MDQAALRFPFHLTPTTPALDRAKEVASPFLRPLALLAAAVVDAVSNLFLFLFYNAFALVVYPIAPVKQEAAEDLPVRRIGPCLTASTLGGESP